MGLRGAGARTRSASAHPDLGDARPAIPQPTARSSIHLVRRTVINRDHLSSTVGQRAAARPPANPSICAGKSGQTHLSEACFESRWRSSLSRCGRSTKPGAHSPSPGGGVAASALAAVARPGRHDSVAIAPTGIAVAIERLISGVRDVMASVRSGFAWRARNPDEEHGVFSVARLRPRRRGAFGAPISAASETTGRRGSCSRARRPAERAQSARAARVAERRHIHPSPPRSRSTLMHRPSDRVQPTPIVNSDANQLQA